MASKLVRTLQGTQLTWQPQQSSREQYVTGLSEPGVLGVPSHPQILADRLTLSLSEGQITPTPICTTGSSEFLDPPTALVVVFVVPHQADTLTQSSVATRSAEERLRQLYSFTPPTPAEPPTPRRPRRCGRRCRSWRRQPWGCDWIAGRTWE